MGIQRNLEAFNYLDTEGKIEPKTGLSKSELFEEMGSAYPLWYSLDKNLRYFKDKLTIQKFFKKSQSTRKSLEEHFVEDQKIKEEESKNLPQTKQPEVSEYFKKIVVDYMVMSAETNDKQTLIMRNAILDYLSVSTENKLKINEAWNA